MQMNQRYCRGLSRQPSLTSGPSSVTLMPLLCGKTYMYERESSWCCSIVSWLGGYGPVTLDVTNHPLFTRQMKLPQRAGPTNDTSPSANRPAPVSSGCCRILNRHRLRFVISLIAWILNLIGAGIAKRLFESRQRPTCRRASSSSSWCV